MQNKKIIRIICSNIKEKNRLVRRFLMECRSLRLEEGVRKKEISRFSPKDEWSLITGHILYSFRLHHRQESTIHFLRQRGLVVEDPTANHPSQTFDGTVPWLENYCSESLSLVCSTLEKYLQVSSGKLKKKSKFETELKSFIKQRNLNFIDGPEAL